MVQVPRGAMQRLALSVLLDAVFLRGLPSLWLGELSRFVRSLSTPAACGCTSRAWQSRFPCAVSLPPLPETVPRRSETPQSHAQHGANR